MRLFVAVGMPKEVLDEAARIQFLLPKFKGNFVQPELMHLTLAFLGETPEQQAEQIWENLKNVKHKGFDAKLKGIGVFPNPSFIRVVWLGVEGEFDSLFKEVSSVMGHRWSQEFHSHITLARIKFIEDKPGFAEALQKINVKEVKFHVGSFKLMQSILEPTGPVYSTLAEFPLE